MSRNGVTKVIAIWKYNKRAANCFPFIFQCTELVDPTANPDVTTAVTDYVLDVLRVTNVTWGPAHVEVIMTESGPR